MPSGKLAQHETEKPSKFKFQRFDAAFNTQDRHGISRMPEHGVGALARDEHAWISSSLGSLTRSLGGSRLSVAMAPLLPIGTQFF